ncbi:MAG TPA: choice-of-anchor tandem repeat GloVer-containing protein [Terriglobales bacterium]|nr:choice-of-anchor tandem repeat GloVer-containing protein [Terriglobales bacterium]
MSLRRRWRMLGVLLVVVILPLLTSAAWAQGKYKTLHTFESSGTGGSALTGGLIVDQSGNLYGTAAFGGTYSQGTVFKLTPGSNGGWAIKVLHSFTGGADGGIPLAALILDQVGNLYGTARQGGNNGAGVVFKLAPNQDGSWTESILYSFTGGADGAVPFAGLIFDQAGNLYGTTVEGGGSTNSACSNGCGTVFKLTAKSDGSWTESVLHSFCLLDACRDGATPFIAGLIFDQTGNLYGTTEHGGNLSQCNGNGCGVVFQLTPNADGSWTENILHRFSSINSYWGVFPLDSLIFDGSGNLYGTAEFGGAAGGGVVFQLTPNADGSWREKVLHSFTGRDGSVPYASLIFDHSGNLYGTTFEGGAGGAGVVFKLTPNSNGGWHETVLHAFHDRPGALPNAGVIFDGAGNLYGTTYGDSNTTFGSVFEITP